MGVRRGLVQQTIAFLSAIESATLMGGSVEIDLRDCVYISRSAGLLLTAQIERCVARTPGCLNGYSPMDLDVCEGLQGLGFYKHLKFHSPLDQSGPLREDSITVRSGRGVIEDLSERLAEVAEVATPLFNDPLFVEQVHAALNEAITNVVGHAYLNETGTLPRTREGSAHEYVKPAVAPAAAPLDMWWFAGHADELTGELILCALDHGGTIPAVAPLRIPDVLKAFWLENPRRVSAARPEPTDAQILEAVARARREQIGTGRRGKGFPTMIGLVENVAMNGSVTVLSGSALYEFRYAGTDFKPLERCFTLNKSFDGTLIEWRISGPRDGRKEV